MHILLLAICGLSRALATEYVSTEAAENDASSPLDCTFEEGKSLSACCWQSPANDSAQASRVKIHMQADSRWYAKRFRAVGLLPPEFSFVALTANGADDGPTLWESCDFCTGTGELELRMRHWQSATSELELCWRPADQQLSAAEEGASCMMMDPRTQFSIDPLALRVPAKMDIKIYFRLRNRSQMRTAIATVLIDYIQMQTQFCSEVGNKEVPNIGEEDGSDKSLIAQPGAALLELDGANDHFDDKNGPKDLVSYELLEAGGSRSSQRAAPTRRLEDTGEDHSLNEIFGEAFANFLTDSNHAEPSTLVKKNIKKLNNANSLIKMHKNVKPCSTPGSCDFEESLCGFANSQIFSSNSQFQRKQIGDSFVAEATINPGEIAVLESATNMTDGDYTILFNHFESATANSMQKPTFSACCYVHGREPAELECPFQSGGASSSGLPFASLFGGPKAEKKPTVSEWKADKIGCPPGTSKLMFTCEFYGTGAGICALDSVRLHRSEDQHLEQRCQQRRESPLE